MGDSFLDLLKPEAEAPAAPRKRAPKVTAAPAGGMAPEQFKAYLEGEESPPVVNGSWGMSPEQEKTFRETWPMVDRPDRSENVAETEKRLGHLDSLNALGSEVFKPQKIKPESRKAVEDYYGYLRDKNKATSGVSENVVESARDLILGPKEDPITSIKNPAVRAQAAAMRDLVDVVAGARVAPGGTKEDELHILTAMMPAPKDTPAESTKKRRAFAAEVEKLAQGMPANEWRAAKRHIVRARKLAAEAAAGGAPVTGANAPPASAQEATGGDEGGGGLGWLKRAVVTGATGLALPAIAGLRTALGETAAEHEQGQAMMMPPGMAGAVGAPPVPTLTPEQRGPSFGQNAAELRDTRARELGEPDSAALEEKMAADRKELPFIARGAQFAGGLLDPLNMVLGLPGKAAEGLSPVMRGLVSYTAPGAVGGAANAAGQGGSATDIAKAAGAGAVLGTVLGKGADKILRSPGKNPLIAQAAKEEGAAYRQTPAEIAARQRELATDIFSRPEATKVAMGDKHALGELGPKIVEWERQLFQKHNIAPGDPIHTMFVAIDDAVKTGDLELAQNLRQSWDALHFSPSLRRDAEALLNVRSLEHAAKGGGHGHGAVSDRAANIHPNMTIANPEAGMGAKVQAVGHLAAEGMGGRGLKGLVASEIRKPLQNAAQGVNAALARLYLARQTGNITAVQAAFEHAISAGVPFSLASQVAGNIGAAGEE